MGWTARTKHGQSCVKPSAAGDSVPVKVEYSGLEYFSVEVKQSCHPVMHMIRA